MILKQITQEDFESKIKKFNRMEDARGQIGLMATNLMNNNFEIEAYLLILSTWNFAGFRYVLTNFNMNKFKQLIKEINPIFDKLKKESFETADFDRLKESIIFIYNKLNPLIKQTGTSKIMYFKNPDLFVMWDMNIREMWKIPKIKTTAVSYVEFLKLMQKNFSHLKPINNDISLARSIDMYNFVVTQEKIRKKKEEKNAKTWG